MTPSPAPPTPAPAFRPSLPVVLSLTAGYVDTAGFLALQGLFTAHVTGNFVTLGASLVHGSSGAIGKLMALPVFCGVVAAARIAGAGLAARGQRRLEGLLVVKLGLLAIAFVLAVTLGPFPNGDSWPALATGMTLVAAMAIQNAVHRVHLGSAPPTTMMTGNTTQMMMDIVDLLGGEGQTRRVVAARVRTLAISIAAFALGCGAGALVFSQAGVWCFAVPPLLALISVRLAWRAGD